MAKKKTDGPKIELEREYNVPLRKGWLKVPKYKRGAKAVKTLKEFLVRHMKVYDRDLRKIKLDILLNNEIRFRGMKKPPAKIKVKAVKYDDGIVEATLVTLPKHIEFELARKAKAEAENNKKTNEKKVVEKEETKVKPEVKKEKEEDKEKEEASKIGLQELERKQAKQAKHVTSTKREPQIHRMALKK